MGRAGRNGVMLNNMIDKKITEILADHESRIRLLEKPLNKKITKIISERNAEEKNYIGPKGGIRLLIERKFLNTKKSADDVRGALNKEGYIYEKQVVQNTLNRLAGRRGPLVVIEEDGKRFYVKRK